MRVVVFVFIIFISAMAVATAGHAAEPRWGTAKTDEVVHKPAKALYDVVTGRPSSLANILDRLSMLQNLYGADPFDASIVVILHGSAIPVFAVKNTQKHENLMVRAASLTQSGVVQFRMCAASAKMQGFSAKDVHGFVTMVPMADAEIIRLQHEGYAYMR